MWEKIKRDHSNIEAGVYYETCLFHHKHPYNFQKLKFERGLWWSDDSTYTYYAPTHFEAVG